MKQHVIAARHIQEHKMVSSRLVFCTAMGQIYDVWIRERVNTANHLGLHVKLRGRFDTLGFECLCVNVYTASYHEFVQLRIVLSTAHWNFSTASSLFILLVSSASICLFHHVIRGTSTLGTRGYSTQMLIYRREVHRVQVFDFGGLPDLMAKGLSARMLMEHRDAQGVSLFTSRAWMRLFDIRGPLVHELILEFFSTFRFGEAVTDLDTLGALQFQLRGARHRLSWRQFIVGLGLHTGEEMESSGFARYWAESARQIPDKANIRDYWIGISSARDFLGITPSYTAIRDSIFRLCHRLIACSIFGRSQALEKVTVTDLFYLRGMDVSSVNIPYLLARYLRLFDAGRKSEALISGVRLQICMEIDDTWAWVALGPERQPDAAVGAHEAAEDAPAVDDDMPQAGQREVLDHMARDFSRFATWTVTSLAQMMDRAGVAYTSYTETSGEYQRCTMRRTDGASTFTAQQDQQ
ncbi:hypothetical protein Tco_1541896 [Tanacetum coccineum]